MRVISFATLVAAYFALSAYAQPPQALKQGGLKVVQNSGVEALVKRVPGEVIEFPEQGDPPPSPAEGNDASVTDLDLIRKLGEENFVPRARARLGRFRLLRGFSLFA